MEEEGRGIFVALEGLDRSGKTTQVAFLRETLEKINTPVRVFRYPTRSGPTGIALSQYLNKTETTDDHAIHLLFSADRWSTAYEIENGFKTDCVHLTGCRQEIEQLLKAGTHVLADRYAYSGIAYSAAKGLDYDWCCQPDKGLPRPDIVIFLDVHAEVAECRGDFGQEVYEKVEFQKKVYNIFMDKVRDSNWRVRTGDNATTSSSVAFFPADRRYVGRRASSQRGRVAFF
ncbi:thymidylate kinase [Trichuris trichiura]|uniref:dTMP kinase n=1 Tax=Trichuris trichiura TaxID=36087 RepID=A0A077Z2J3_TRITR|nr:thymidylate kinase [Trichuris trichiura]